MVRHTSQSTDPYLFSGFIMVTLQNIHVPWHDFVYETCSRYKDALIEPEFMCHVTLGGGYHRDDIIRLQHIDLPVWKLSALPVESKLSYFDNAQRVAKFKLQTNNEPFQKLRILREMSFTKCRCIEKWPQFNPHITLGYFKPGTPVEATLVTNLFTPVHLLVSYKDETGVPHTRTL